MKKWIIPFLSLFLVCSLVYLSGPFSIFKTAAPVEERGNPSLKWAQDAEKQERRDEIDSHWVAILKQVQDKLNTWLKSINERIDSGEVSQIEIRFLEILRNVLEWLKEKVDAKIESSKGKDSPKKKDLFQETWRRESLQMKRG